MSARYEPMTQSDRKQIDMARANVNPGPKRGPIPGEDRESPATRDAAHEVDPSLRDAALVVAREADLRLVVVFGSTARGEERAEDLDLAVQGNGPVDMVEITNRFTVLLGRQDADVVDLRRAEPVLLMQVARDGVPLFEQTSSEFACLYSLAARRFADTKKFRDAEREAIRGFVGRQDER